MKVKASLMALAFAALIGCGSEDKKEAPAAANNNQSNAQIDAADQAKLNEISATLPKNVLTRVPVVNGVPQYDKVEAIETDTLVDAKGTSVKSLGAMFDSSSAKRISNIGVSNVSEGSTEQCRGRGCGCRGYGCGGGYYPAARPWVTALPPWVNWGCGSRCGGAYYAYSYGAGYNNYGYTYPVSSGCCQTYQPTCGNQNYYYSYQSQTSVVQSSNGGGYYGGGYPGGYNGGYGNNGFNAPTPYYGSGAGIQPGWNQSPWG